MKRDPSKLRCMLYFTFFWKAIFSFVPTTTVAVKTFLTCLLTFARPLFKNVDSSSITERGNKHSFSPSHSRRDTLTEVLKGRTVNASNRWGRGKHSKIGRLRVLSFLWEVKGHMTLKALEQTQCPARQVLYLCSHVMGPILRECTDAEGERTCGIIYRACTEHYRSFSFNFTTYLFSLLGQSPIIWQ